MRRSVIGALGTVPLVLATVGSGVAQAADTPPTTYTDGLYIVQMVDAPVAAYDGSTPGLPATKPDNGRKISKKSPEVRSYVQHLQKSHDQALAKAGAQGKLYDYSYSFNGFAAHLSADEAAAMAKAPGVLLVSKSQT